MLRTLGPRDTARNATSVCPRRSCSRLEPTFPHERLVLRVFLVSSPLEPRHRPVELFLSKALVFIDCILPGVRLGDPGREVAQESVGRCAENLSFQCVNRSSSFSISARFAVQAWHICGSTGFVIVHLATTVASSSATAFDRRSWRNEIGQAMEPYNIEADLAVGLAVSSLTWGCYRG